MGGLGNSGLGGGEGDLSDGRDVSDGRAVGAGGGWLFQLRSLMRMVWVRRWRRDSFLVGELVRMAWQGLEQEGQKRRFWAPLRPMGFTQEPQ